MSAAYSIGDLARATGVKPTTIRWYEQEGWLPPPARTEGGQGLLAGMVLQPLGVLLGRLGIQADGDQEAHHQVMPRLCGGRHVLAGLGQEQPAIGLGFHQPVALQAADRVGHRRLGDPHAAGDIDRPRLPILAQEVGDQLDIILGGGGPVGLALAGEGGGLVLGRGQAARCGVSAGGHGEESGLEVLDSGAITS